MSWGNFPIINGVAYGWSSVRVNLFGRPVMGIDSINYSEEETIEGQQGAGQKAVAIGRGEISFSGSITLHKQEVDAIKQRAPQGRIQLIEPFVIIVSYKAGGVVTTDRLKNCLFTTNQIDTSTGDQKIPVELPLFIGDIKWGQKS